MSGEPERRLETERLERLLHEQHSKERAGCMLCRHLISHDPVKLNIGAGSTEIPGWTAIDRKLGTEAFPLAYADDSVDEIRASHILEYFSFADADKALREWVRVLKPGGRIRIAVPDVDKAAVWPDKQERLFFLMGGQNDADEYHRSAYDADRLEALMDSVGLKWIEPWTSSNTDTAAHPVSLNREGVKPVAATEPPSLPRSNITVESDQAVIRCGAYMTLLRELGLNREGIKPIADAEPPVEPSAPALPRSAITVESDQAVIRCGAYMTLPRYEAVTSRLVIETALRELGIPCTTSQGVYWGQCMQRMFQEAVDADLDWILSIDSDSLFASEQLSLLCDVFAQTPEADAMAALQCRRGSPYPLMTTGSTVDTTIEINRNRPLKVTTAHFGLTLFRVDALKQVAKPWFVSRPEEDGNWGDGRLDDDIWFWHQWRLAGKSIYVAPQVSIGHLEETVAVFDRECNPQHLYVHEWREQNLTTVKKS